VEQRGVRAPHRTTSKWSEVEQIEANYIIISTSGAKWSKNPPPHHFGLSLGQTDGERRREPKIEGLS
jgi:hypothetical protein